LPGQRKWLGNAFDIDDACVAACLRKTTRAEATQEAEQREQEDRLRQTAKLESLGVLAGVIAHDFNNLLTEILGNANAALENAAPDSKMAESVRGVVHAGECAAALTQQMMAYASQRVAHLAYVDLSELVSEILALIESAVGARTRLNLDMARDLPSVHADPSQLQQIVMNLAINAAEAVGRKGEVYVHTGVTTLDGSIHPDDVSMVRAALAGRYVFLEVRDTGAGMDAPTLQRIFDPFFTTKLTGRGLGLAAVIGIVRKHNGALRVTSALGAGSKFTVFFPVSEHPVTWPNPVAVRNRFFGTETVLVVDDEEYIRETVRRSLEHAGYAVVCAAGPSAALELFRSLASQIELAIVDLKMSTGDGYEIVRRLRYLNPKLRVIATSGYPEEAKERCGDSINAFLPKPYRFEQLREVVASVLAR
jgi:two-component system cell cycle sensor histidine kinase/response regulator CckA